MVFLVCVQVKICFYLLFSQLKKQEPDALNISFFHIQSYQPFYEISYFIYKVVIAASSSSYTNWCIFGSTVAIIDFGRIQFAELSLIKSELNVTCKLSGGKYEIWAT